MGSPLMGLNECSTLIILDIIHLTWQSSCPAVEEYRANAAYVHGSRQPGYVHLSAVLNLAQQVRQITPLNVKVKANMTNFPCMHDHTISFGNLMNATHRSMVENRICSMSRVSKERQKDARIPKSVQNQAPDAVLLDQIIQW